MSDEKENSGVKLKARDSALKRYDIRAQLSNKEGITEVEEMQAKHREIVRLSALGKKNIEIARMLGCCAGTVQKVLEMPITQRYKADLQASRDEYLMAAQEELTELLPSVTQLYRDIINQDIQTKIELRVDLAKDIMDRMGLPKTKKSIIESANISAKITAKDLEALRANKDQTELAEDAVVENAEEQNKEQENNEQG